MPEQPDPLGTEIDIEIARARTGAEPADDDEPEREPYLTRLLSLRHAVIADEPEDGSGS
jgi:hypothetical protein